MKIPHQNLLETCEKHVKLPWKIHWIFMGFNFIVYGSKEMLCGFWSPVRAVRVRVICKGTGSERESHLVLHSWLLDPQQSTPTQTFYNSSVGFTYMSTDIIYKNIYKLLQDVQCLVWIGMEGRRIGIWCSFLFVKILAVKRGFHSFPYFLGNFEQLVLFVRSVCLEF